MRGCSGPGYDSRIRRGEGIPEGETHYIFPQRELVQGHVTWGEPNKSEPKAELIQVNLLVVNAPPHFLEALWHRSQEVWTSGTPGS